MCIFAAQAICLRRFFMPGIDQAPRKEEIMKEMFGYLRPYWKGLLLSTLGICMATFCDLLLPTIMSEILNNGISRADMNYVIRCCVVMLAVALTGLGSFLWGSKISCNVVESFSADIRAVTFRKVNQMSFEEFGTMGTAALVTRCSHDVETVSWIAAELCGTLVSIPVLFFGGVVLALRKDVMLSMTLLLCLPVVVAFVLYTGRNIVPLWKKCDTYIDKENAIVRERLRGIRVIRAFNAEPREHDRIENALKVMTDSMIKSNVAMGAVAPLASFLLSMAGVLIVYLGGWRMETEQGLTGGDIFAIIQYIGLAASGVIMGAFTVLNFPQAKIAADRIGQVLHAQAMEDPHEKQDLTFAGDICFENVSFRYQGAAESALENITFHIRPGQQAAVIGGTGSGKSTLVSMLLGFRMPTCGTVKIDGCSTEQLSRRTMRENMSCVLQNATIYSGTIRENVRMGKLDATDEQILGALEIAQAREFVDSFSDGLDYEIKQSGKNLSGGQKQRLSIARAVVKNAPIYLFDDSFSALDFLTEAKLRSALNRKLAGKTQLIITQRISSAMHCNVIFVLDGGRLVDQGSHEHLLRHCQVYREIYASQTGGESHEAEEE